MNIKKLNRKGFSHVEMAIVVLVVAALGFVGYRVLKNTSHAGSLCKGQALQVGSTGQCVKDAQTLSIAFTGIKMPIDGKYGPLTKANILTFQKKAFSNASAQWDGIAGPNTWSKLCSLIPMVKTQAVYNAQKDACGSASFSVSVQPTPIPTSTSYGFNYPYAITADNLGHIWVANTSGSSVTELNAKDGSLVKVLSASSYGFIHPNAITSDNLGHVWVANANGGSSVTELNAKDGSLVQIVK